MQAVYEITSFITSFTVLNRFPCSDLILVCIQNHQLDNHFQLMDKINFSLNYWNLLTFCQIGTAKPLWNNKHYVKFLLKATMNFLFFHTDFLFFYFIFFALNENENVKILLLYIFSYIKEITFSAAKVTANKKCWWNQIMVFVMNENV